MRLHLSTTYTYNDSLVTGPPMASYLTRNGSKFWFSHEFIWCPVQDLINCLDDVKIDYSVRKLGKMTIMENKAVDYLCRPSSLEDCVAFDFYREYYKKFVKVQNPDDDVMPFQSTKHFNHPSMKNGRIRQGVCKREELEIELTLIELVQYWFPDTAQFKGSIFDSATKITTETEKYAQHVLALFHPYRCKQDLLGADGTYTTKLREIGKDGIAQIHQDYLNNLQDARANFERYPRMEDELEQCTERFSVKDGRGSAVVEEGGDSDEDSKDEDDDNQNVLAEFMEYLLGGSQIGSHNVEIPNTFSFSGITEQRTKKNL